MLTSSVAILLCIAALALFTSDAEHVTPPKSPVAASCTGPEPVECVQAELDTELMRSGPAAALALLTELQDRDEAIRASCHVLTHHIGQQAAAGDGDLEALLGADDGQCQWGYQHGVLEGWALRTTPEQLATWLPNACDTYPTGTRNRDSCGHSLGHAIAMQGPESIWGAVRLCELVSPTDRVGCVGGVLMSYSTGKASQGGALPRYPLHLAREEVEGLCMQLDAEYRQECANKTWMLTKQVGLGVEAGAELCPPGHLDACWRGFGARIFYESDVDGESALQRCMKTSAPDPCALGVVQAAAGAWVGTDRPRDTYRSLCTKLPASLLEDCTRTERIGLTFSSASDTPAAPRP